jgi:hypothetical protein
MALSASTSGAVHIVSATGSSSSGDFAMRIGLVLAITLLFGASSAVRAQAVPLLVPLVPPPEPKARKAAELVCQDEVMPGTRLQMRHTCGTAAQWREYRQNMRYDMDRVGIISSGQ